MNNHITFLRRHFTPWRILFHVVAVYCGVLVGIIAGIASVPFTCFAIDCGRGWEAIGLNNEIVMYCFGILFGILTYLAIYCLLCVIEERVREVRRKPNQ